MLERESITTGQSCHNSLLRMPRNTPCFKNRTNTGFKVCAILYALERTGQILRYFDLHVLVINTGLIVYAIVSANRVNSSSGIDIILRNTPYCMLIYTVLYVVMHNDVHYSLQYCCASFLGLIHTTCTTISARASLLATNLCKEYIICRFIKVYIHLSMLRVGVS